MRVLATNETIVGFSKLIMMVLIQDEGIVWPILINNEGLPIEWKYYSNNSECHWQWGYYISICLECEGLSRKWKYCPNFWATMRISRNVEGIAMKSYVYNEGLNLWWGYCKPYRLATNFLPCIDENIVWFFGLIFMV